jgi:hypothetical protein
MYLIDGNNLIGHTKSISYKDPQARQQVLDRMCQVLGIEAQEGDGDFRRHG